jgi:hypothetical protein
MSPSGLSWWVSFTLLAVDRGGLSVSFCGCLVHPDRAWEVTSASCLVSLAGGGIEVELHSGPSFLGLICPAAVALLGPHS